MESLYRIEIIANSTPNEVGFHDFITLFDHRGKILNSSIGSQCPNQTSVNGLTDWVNKYGWMAPGSYPIETIEDHPRFGRCVLINNGAPIPARMPNVNHNNRFVISALFIHAGGTGSNKLWRGSGGCPTVQEQHWVDFSEALPVGKGVLVVFDRVGR